jgi:hypothetical protein
MEITPTVIMGKYKGKTAAQWRDMAEVSRAAGHKFTPREWELCADLAEMNGVWEFPALFSLTGALVPDSVWIKTRLSKWVWRIGTGQTVVWFDPSRARCGARRRANDRAKGYQVGLIRARAYVGTAARGCFIAKVDNSPIEIVDNGTLGTQYKDN